MSKRRVLDVHVVLVTGAALELVGRQLSTVLESSIAEAVALALRLLQHVRVRHTPCRPRAVKEDAFKVTYSYS